MIVPMKKVSLLVMDKDKETSLEQIRGLGLVHVEKKEVQSEKLSRLLEKQGRTEQAKGILLTYAPKKGQSIIAASPVQDVTSRVMELFDKKKSTQDRYFNNAKEINRIKKWGSFEPEAFKELASQGLTLIPYELSLKSYERIGENKIIVLKKEKLSVLCVAVDGPIAGEQPFALPVQSLADFKKEQETLLQTISGIEKEFTALYPQANVLQDELTRIIQDIEFETAKTGMDSIEDAPQELSVSWITGYVPSPEVGVLKRAAAENNWALYADDSPDDEVPPTLTKNNAFVRLIQPVFSFLGTTPGYREYDISFSYLIFFCIFFAMIYGDVAYGLIIFVITFLIGISYKKKTGKIPDAVKLFSLLSICTIVWGALNGAWFAIPYEKLPRFLQALVLPQFNSSVPLAAFPGILQKLIKIPAEQPTNTAYWNAQFLCFTIAIIQLVYAHLKNIKKLLPSAVAIAQFGWLVMMIGLYFLVLSMLLKIELPPFAIYFIGIGLGVYFIFAEQKGGNPFANVGKSFANFLPTFLNAVSSFADIISYIRLFAVGLAGTSIAQSFNSMSGIQSGLSGSVLSIILKLFGAVLILIFGHGLNMVMNALSVIVHGVRLNLLEYAGNHLGMEWSGYSYKPFAVKQK